MVRMQMDLRGKKSMRMRCGQTETRWWSARSGRLVRAWAMAMALTTAGAAAAELDLLDMEAGALVLSHPGQYNEDWPAMALIDGNLQHGWSSTRGLPFPASFLVELGGVYAIDRIAADNSGNDEHYFGGISARRLSFEGSVEGPASGYQPIGNLELPAAGRAQQQLAQAVPARWIRITIESNHGHPSFTELMELEAYGKPVGAQPVHPDYSGHFMSNYRMVQFRRQGDRVEGCYDLDGGYLWGWTDGRVMRINWREHEGEQAGIALLVVSASGDFFNGLWYEGAKLSGTWFGNREVNGQQCRCDIDGMARLYAPPDWLQGPAEPQQSGRQADSHMGTDKQGLQIDGTHPR